MEKNNLKSIKWIIICLAIVLIIFLTIYKVTKNREQKLYNVLYSKIEYKANKCFLDKICSSPMTLNDLYEKTDLEELYDPITKELLDKNITIEYKDNKVIINNNNIKK